MAEENDDLHRPLYVADVLANALSTDSDRPLLHLQGGPTLTVGEMRDAVSQFVQALASLGVGRGTRIALIFLTPTASANGRPRSLGKCQTSS